MEIHLSKNKKLSEIQADFQEKLPKLKIEFFNNEHGDLESSEALDQIQADQLELISPPENAQDITINSEMMVSEVEKLFMEKMYINVQIFRKAGKIWIETVHTDHWSLNKQIEHAN